MGNQSFNRDSCQNLHGKNYRSYKGDVGPAEGKVVQNEVTSQESRAKRSCSGTCLGFFVCL